MLFAGKVFEEVLTCAAKRVTVVSPRKEWGEYRSGIGTGSFRLRLLKAASRPSTIETTAKI
jgi:hypothetical protein